MPRRKCEVSTLKPWYANLSCSLVCSIHDPKRLVVHAGYAGHSWGTLASIAAVVSVAVLLSSRRSDSDAGPDPLPPLVYDIEEVEQYWSQRPVAVARRSVAVAYEGVRWGIGEPYPSCLTR